MSESETTKASITFYGGAGTVTGANFLLDAGDVKILVDCGALERKHLCDDSNSLPFPYDPRSVDALIVTHAHADHIGRIPKLVHDGFKGTIYSTAATKDLAELMFDDAIKVMETDMEKKGCTMMYQKEDAAGALALWRTRDYHEPFEIGSATVEFFDAGHILGSAMIKITRREDAAPLSALRETEQEKVFSGVSQADEPRISAGAAAPDSDPKIPFPVRSSILFTGDLGNSPEPLLNDTEIPEGVNYMVMESVYGDRLHEDREDRVNVLRQAIENARERQGVLLIPSFSIERTQILLYEIEKMMQDGTMTPMPVYLDAPLAIKITDIFRRHRNLLNGEARARFETGDDPFTFNGLAIVRDAAASREIHASPNPKVIIAGAGMSSGGRIRKHEKRYLPDRNATVLFVGYQAPGSLGRQIQDGTRSIRIDGETARIRARIMTLTGYSGHKDRDGLMDFVERMGESLPAGRQGLEKVFVVMGEPKSEMFFSQRIRDFLGVDAIAPEQGETIEINW